MPPKTIHSGLSLHAAGWFKVVREVDGEPVTAYAKTKLVNGRRVVTKLVIVADHIDSNITSRFPIGWVEMMLNTGLAPHGQPGGPYDHLVDEAEDQDKDVLTEAIAIVDETERAAMSLIVDQAGGPLTRPDGTDPDGFAQRVAAAVAAAVTAGKPVAPTLAEEAGVPVRTVHRWIAEARRRGYVQPGRRGRSA